MAKKKQAPVITEEEETLDVQSLETKRDLLKGDLETAKSQCAQAKAKRDEFQKTHKLYFGKKSENPKINKEHQSLVAEHKSFMEVVANLESVIKDLNHKIQPNTGRVAFAKKYEYPEGMTDSEKKSYRAKMRKEAAKGEKSPPEEENKRVKETQTPKSKILGAKKKLGKTQEEAPGKSPKKKVKPLSTPEEDID